MRIHSSQLVPGCVLSRPVKGKTGLPIFREKMALDEQHIAFLHAFLIEEVDVQPTLADGDPFKPLERSSAQHEEKVTSQSKQSKNMLSKADACYQHAVNKYWHLFETWQSNTPVDMLKVRHIANLLTERVDDFAKMMISLPAMSAENMQLAHHAISICIMSVYLGKKMGLPKKDIQQIGIAGLLCDAGLAKIPKKMAAHGDVEGQHDKAQFHKHPIYSYRMIEKAPALHHLSKIAVLQHHERLDGSGYPMGLKASKLHLYGKIIAVCDTYYSLKCKFPDHSPYKLLEDMKRNEFSRLDPVIMKRMLQCFPDLSVGSMVQLSNGESATVMFQEPNAPIRPIVRLAEGDEIISLKDRPSIWIEQKEKTVSE